MTLQLFLHVCARAPCVQASLQDLRVWAQQPKPLLRGERYGQSSARRPAWPSDQALAVEARAHAAEHVEALSQNPITAVRRGHGRAWDGTCSGLKISTTTCFGHEGAQEEVSPCRSPLCAAEPEPAGEESQPRQPTVTSRVTAVCES